LLVYDITNSESFESIQKFWINEVESYADPGATLILIGKTIIIKETSLICEASKKSQLSKLKLLPVKKRWSSLKPQQKLLNM
jgi:Ras-related protein Rab-1A